MTNYQSRINSPHMPTVLGHTFDNDDARRAFFREELRKQLPELRKLEGFPHGTDEDILALSDPPYYTACPNPWLDAFIAEWEAAKADTPGRQEDWEVEGPYASDVSEGKNNPIYNAHSYHTKVPHPAIMRYILHYTQPGDIVFDGFAGTGMTGVAAQLCGKPDAALKAKIEQERKQQGLTPPVWGARKAILGDLSPIASFIAYNYNTPVDVLAFEQEAQRILAEVEAECGWMYETRHTNGKMGKIKFTIWSDVLLCKSCNKEMVYWDVAVDQEKDAVLKELVCPNCGASQEKREAEKAWVSNLDSGTDEVIRQNKIVPVFINYSYGGKRYKKVPDQEDLDLIERVNTDEIANWFPTDLLPDGYNTQQPIRSNGVKRVHQFYSPRNLRTLAATYSRSKGEQKFILTALIKTLSRMFRWAPKGKHTAGTTGTLYLPSITHEYPIFDAYRRRLSIYKDLLSIRARLGFDCIIFSGSASATETPTDSVDYIFTDPPFGANIMYSELNFLPESWLKVKTNNGPEAIENKVQGKGFSDYVRLMTQSFREYHRILKPGKWMTVEFSNTNAAIWNGIQTALQQAGFIVANVAALDKKQGSFKAVTTTTAVKQDLVISCYKPSSEFDARFRQHQQSEVGVWDFVEEHLQRLPIHLQKDGSTTAIVERSPKILYDRMIAFYVQRGLPVPLDAGAFQLGLKQRYVERDGMHFLQEQATVYDHKKRSAPTFQQLSLLVSSEQDGVLWLKARLQDQPQTYQELQPQWMQSLGGVRKGDALPELRDILEENFLQDKTTGAWQVPDPENASDLEQIRTKRLLKVFDTYRQQLGLSAPQNPKPQTPKRKPRKLKEVRVEALRAGFKQCYQDKDFATIVAVGDILPQNLLMEDEVLLQFYDIASTRV